MPLFVLDDPLLARSPGRSAFLVECLHDLDGSLRSLGGGLVVRAGHEDPVGEVVQLTDEIGASAVFLAADAASRARRREEALLTSGRRLDVRVFDCHTVVGPGTLAPPGKTHYRVFSPYHRAWTAAPWRSPEDRPACVLLPERLDRGTLPARTAVPDGWVGGEGEARRRARRWLETGSPAYATLRNVVSAEGTSRLSPYLRFGCLSPLELALRAGPGEFQRQLCWRDFYFQLLSANPWSETRDLVPSRVVWDDDEDALAAWREGRTGYPLVDAGMRQLAAEGWMHNRTRMVTASFLTKHLNVDWRHGARHFDRLLLDGDPANNVGGWQWVAGTGADTRPGRMFNPSLQAARFDPEGDYVRRYVPELAHLPAPLVHEPWRLAGTLDAPAYPAPIVVHTDAVAAYRHRLAAARRTRSAESAT